MTGSRILLVATAATLALTGCKESIGEPLPLEQARQAEWHYPAYEMTPAPTAETYGVGRRLQAEGRTWAAYDAPDRFFGPGYGVRIPAAQMRPIGSVDGVALHALAHDSPPYARLYSPLGPDRWRQYQSITR
jgi:hypothetical protein